MNKTIAIVLGCVALCGAGAWAAERPNVVLIMADDMGYSDIGCFGGEIPTPHIDALAEGGVRFTQFYNTGRCCPTRASLLTGLYPHEAGVGHMVYADKGAGYRGRLSGDCVTIAEVLRDAGYRTMMTGKWHIGHQKGQWPSDRGFERFYGIHLHVDSYFKVLRGCDVYEDDRLAIGATADPPNALKPGREWYTTEVFTDWALKFIDESAGEGRPFFLYVAYNAPHWPLEAPEENIKRFAGKYAQGWDELRRTKLARMKELGIVPGDTGLPDLGNAKWAELSEADREELEFRREIYAAQIDSMDGHIGRLIGKLKQTGAYENTLILFLSDNGCAAERGMFGFNWGKHTKANYARWRAASGRSVSQGQAWAGASNTPFRWYKRWVHEGGIATPLIAHWPAGVERPGRLTSTPGHVVDVMATVCDVAGAAYPRERGGRAIKPQRGVSLLSELRGKALEVERPLYWEHEKHAAVRVGRWKLVTLDASDEGKWELYDMATDRVEGRDLAAQMPERAEAMREMWWAWARACDVVPWPSER